VEPGRFVPCALCAHLDEVLPSTPSTNPPPLLSLCLMPKPPPKDLCPGRVWNVKEGCPGKRWIRGRSVTSCGQEDGEAAVVGLYPEALPGPQCSPLSYWGWPGPMMGAEECYCGSSSAFFRLCAQKTGIYRCQLSPQAQPSPLHPQWATAGILDVAFISPSSPESISLPEQSYPSAARVHTVPCTVDSG